MTSQGAGVRPAFSNSSASGGWFLDDSCILFERDKETMFTTTLPRLLDVAQGVFGRVSFGAGSDAYEEHWRVAVGSKRQKL